VFFGGSKKSIAWLTKSYYDLLEHYHSLGEFVGIEEQLLLAVAMLNPLKIMSIPGYLYRSAEMVSFDHVFFYQTYLAHPEQARNTTQLPRAHHFNEVPLYPPCGIEEESNKNTIV